MEFLASAEPGSAVWFWAAAATIIATLASTVAALYKSQIAMKDTDIKEAKARETALQAQLDNAKDDYKVVIDKLTEEVEVCRKDREELRVDMARFEERLTMLESHDRDAMERGGRTDKRLDDLEQQS